MKARYNDIVYLALYVFDTGQLSMMNTGLRWLWLTVAVVVLDLSSKFYIASHIAYGWVNRIEVTSFFNILHVHNLGAAFSFLSNAGGLQRWFFVGIAFIIILVLCYALAKNSVSARWQNIAYTLIIGGAAGNVFDRLYHGYVIDFLDFYINHYHWPAFNVADIAISLGACLLFIEALWGEKKRVERKKTKGSETK